MKFKQLRREICDWSIDKSFENSTTEGSVEFIVPTLHDDI